ncbi:hypothetical protein CRE_06792 [Caenorhabditis remanei]|uniref:Uncharacterized protein n=1 Tax=Caenorhabditis remanei TaxID=31234 RepID=E3MNU6_CAERE|nr:hypothetical protein CRE_06792 [Caenorhabditis remanei]
MVENRNRKRNRKRDNAFKEKIYEEKETYNPKKAAVEYKFLRSLNTGLLVAFCVMEWRSKFSKKGTKKNNDDYSWLLWLLNALVDFAEIKEIPTDEEGRVVLFLARLFVYIMAYFGVQVATFEKQLNWSESGGGVIGATIGLVLWETFCKLFEMTFTQLPSISNSTMTLQ